MSSIYPSHYYIARITLENRTALSIVTGIAHELFDSQLVVDANGLPMIPGTALAGVLRHLCQREYGQQTTEALFGFQERRDGQRSAVTLSAGMVQNSRGETVQGVDWSGQTLKDPLYHYLHGLIEQPQFRDRVRLTHRGVAADEGKFDRAILPAGFRFSVEMVLYSDQAEDPHWPKLLQLFAHPLFRLGGSSRSGLGAMTVIALYQRHFDLCDPQAASAYRQLAPQLHRCESLHETPLPTLSTTQLLQATLQLQPIAFWRMGQGDHTLQQPAAEKPADLLPKVEPKVNWAGGTGELESQMLLVAAAGVKGALSHRIAYHHNHLTGHHAEGNSSSYDHRENEAVKALFGFMKEESSGGQAGYLYLDDALLPINRRQITSMMHVAIDRYTGGARDRMLFEEELIGQTPITLHLTLDTRPPFSTETRHALQLALDDLLHGRLALGAGSSKGHGYFNGTIEWSDNGAWIKTNDGGAA